MTLPSLNNGHTKLPSATSFIPRMLGVIGSYAVGMTISNSRLMNYDMQYECDEHMEHGGESMVHKNITHTYEKDWCFTGTMEKNFKVKGIKCVPCVKTIEKILSKLEGVR